MRLTRRRLLASVVGGGSVTVSGCEGLATPDDAPTTGDAGPKEAESAERETAGPEAPTDGPVEDGGEAEARGVRVSNEGKSRYVTVVVETDAGETVFAESRRFPADTGNRFPAAVRQSGRYRVVVETAEGAQTAFEWDATGPVGDAAVSVSDDGVTTTQLVRCAPDCDPLSRGGTARGYPRGGFDPRGRRADCEIRLRNETDEARRSHVRVGRTPRVLDYRYRIPAATTISLPVPQHSGETHVVVETTDDETTSLVWRMEVTPRLVVRLGVDRTGDSRNRSRLPRRNND